MKMHKPKFWRKKNLIAILLAPLSLLFIILFYVKKIISQNKKFSLKVICVGNIYVGGTGKTPLTLHLAKLLNDMGLKTAIIKKYYVNQMDEIKFLRNKHNNVISEKSRIDALKIAEQSNAKVAILDDGFQDDSIYKNLNILCFNSEQLIGNGMTMPSGPLRGPLRSIKNCNIIIINGNKNESFEKKLKNISNNIRIFYSRYIPLEIENFKDGKFLAFAGIGNSNNFFNLLNKYGIRIIEKLSFPDHYKYTNLDIKNITNLAKNKNLRIITTEKDFYRLQYLGFRKFDYLKIQVDLIEEKNFKTEVKKFLK